MTKSYIVLLLLFTQFINAQLGCTDSNANNYNAAATTNNGSCTYNPSTQIVSEIGLLTPTVPESSGLVYENGFIWTHNDSGNANAFYKINASTGAILQTITISNFSNIDWEEITADNDYFYIGDFGNNSGDRTNLKVLKIDKSQFINSTATTVSVTATAINFSYADQTSFVSNQQNNFDCEAMISVGNYLYLFTKNRGDFQTKVYKLDKTVGTYSLNVYSTYNISGLLTGASYNAATNEVVLLGYLPPNATNSFLYYLNDFNTDLFFSGNVRRVEIGNSNDAWQTEAVAFKNANEIFISCETTGFTNAKLFLSNKSSITLNNKDFENEQKLIVYPNPASDFLNIDIENSQAKISIFNLLGQEVFASNQDNLLTKNQLRIDISSLKEGIYFLNVLEGQYKSIIKFIKKI
jgi:Secretion system C-terminal sorting domain